VASADSRNKNLENHKDLWQFQPMTTKPDKGQATQELEQGALVAAREAALAAAPRDLFGLPVVLPRRSGARAPNGEPSERRPKQVRRRTLVSVQYLLEKFGNPIEGLLRMASYDIDDLAVFLQVSRHEAWIEKRLLLAAAAPYLVSKMPQGHVIAPAPGLTITGFNFADPPPGTTADDATNYGAGNGAAALGDTEYSELGLIERLEQGMTIEVEAQALPETAAPEELGNFGPLFDFDEDEPPQ
jgi:hypothetical protein